MFSFVMIYLKTCFKEKETKETTIWKKKNEQQKIQKIQQKKDEMKERKKERKKEDGAFITCIVFLLQYMKIFLIVEFYSFHSTRVYNISHYHCTISVKYTHE